MRRATVASAACLLTLTSAVQAVTIATFDEWLPNSVYGAWGTNGDLSPNPTNFGVQATGFGGGYADIIPNPDGTGMNTVQLTATVNSGVAGFIVALGDTSGHELNYAWYGNTPTGGTNGTKEYTLRKAITDFSFSTGIVGQLDVAHIDYMHIQVDPGGPNLTTRYDVTYNDLSLINVAVAANLSWNNAGGSGDGTTWDVATNQNWNNGTAPAVFNQGDNVTFNGTNNGHTAVTINSAVNPGSTTVNSPVAYIFSGTGGIGGAGGLTVSGAGPVTLNTLNTYSGATTVNAGATLNVNGTLGATAINASGNVNFGASTGSGIYLRTLGPITLASGGKVTVATPSSAAKRTLLVTSALNFGGTATAPQGVLDLTSNDMIVRGGNADTVRTQLKAGLTGTAGITWTGGAASNKRLGYAATTTAGTFDGQAVAVGDVVVKYTLAGDADLTGDVSFDDLVALAQNYNASNTNWKAGDFDYNGMTDFDDLVSLAQNYNQSLSVTESSQLNSSFAADFALAQSLVPEPGVLSLIGLGGAALMRRRNSGAMAR